MHKKSGTKALALAVLLAAALCAAPALAARAKKPAKLEPEKKIEEPAKGAAKGKTLLAGEYGDWKVYVTPGDKNKTCYALAHSLPAERLHRAHRVFTDLPGLLASGMLGK